MPVGEPYSTKRAIAHDLNRGVHSFRAWKRKEEGGESESAGETAVCDDARERKSELRARTAVGVAMNELGAANDDGGDAHDAVRLLRRKRGGRAVRRARHGMMMGVSMVAVWLLLLLDGCGMAVRMGRGVRVLYMRSGRGGCVHDTAGLTSIALLVGRQRPGKRGARE